jgi:hypothetical protein
VDGLAQLLPKSNSIAWVSVTHSHRVPSGKPIRSVNLPCTVVACNEEHIITKGRKKNKASEVAMHLARYLSGMFCKDLGIYFGGVSVALITIMCNRIAQEVAQNRCFKHRLEKTKKRILNI